ncbi:MAG: rod shape-determining protein [Armatimonadota bacterium]
MLPWVAEIAIDIGTANTHVAVKDGGEVVREPSVVAYADRNGQPTAYGTEAQQMLDQGVSDVEVVHPIVDGVVADYNAGAAMVRHFIHKALGRRPLFNPLVVSAHPSAATPVQRRALRQLLRASGAGRVVTIQKSLAAAIGAGLAVDSGDSQMIIDIGAGTTDAAIVSMGMTSDAISRPLGGQYLDEMIVRGVKRRNNADLARHDATELKIATGAVGNSFSPENGNFSARADDLRSLGVEIEQIPIVLTEAADDIADELSWMLECLPAKVRAHIAGQGAVMSGGTALLRGLYDHIANHIGIPISRASDPMACTMLGLQAVLNNLSALSLDGRRVQLHVSG